MFELRPAAAAFAFILAATPAFAHSHPVTMLPAKDSTVSAPTELSVVFSEDLDAKGSSLKLENSSGEIVSKDASMLDPAHAKHMTLKLPKLAPGVYTVAWITLSTDGHRLMGRYGFTVK